MNFADIKLNEKKRIKYIQVTFKQEHALMTNIKTKVQF